MTELMHSCKKKKLHPFHKKKLPIFELFIIVYKGHFGKMIDINLELMGWQLKISHKLKLEKLILISET